MFVVIKKRLLVTRVNTVQVRVTSIFSTRERERERGREGGREGGRESEGGREPKAESPIIL